MTQTMNLVHVQYAWGSDCYDNISGFENHTVIGADYTAWFHFANTYDAIVNVLPCNECGVSADISDPLVTTMANQNWYDAEGTATYLWDNLCINGVHVVERYVDYWVWDYFPEGKSALVVGTHWNIYVWGDSDCANIDRANPYHFTQ